jgi:hypothetical protein
VLWDGDLIIATNKVIDMTVRKGEVKSWSDKIEIIIGHKSKFVTRKSAYKFGLCERA